MDLLQTKHTLSNEESAEIIESENSVTESTRATNNNDHVQQILERTIIAKNDVQRTVRYPYSLLATIVSTPSAEQAVVHFTLENKHYECTAITTLTLNKSHQHQSCVLSFNQGYLDQPIIMGMVQTEAKPKTDEKPIVLQSNDGIILQCGASRIELDENGTINIQGMHINSQAYGPHRIKGGSVKIN